MIKVYVVSPAIYVFEVGEEKGATPPEWMAVPQFQKCYFPVKGSIAVYRKGVPMTVVLLRDFDMWFPASDCRDPTKEELDEYNELPLV